MNFHVTNTELLHFMFNSLLSPLSLFLVNIKGLKVLFALLLFA